jgi:ADP-ribosyl-[dinitrogen reductase] hydrolase
MTGGGPFGLEAGHWTDDTVMALCLAESLLACEGFDARDQMERYVRWYRTGYMSPTGRCFDIGNTVRAALHRFESTGEPVSGSTDPYSAGNGSIMRLAPVVLFYHPDALAVDHFTAESSRTTHGAEEAVAGCRILAAILHAGLLGKGKEEILLSVPPSDWMPPRLQGIAAGDYREKDSSEIRGSGYVADSLEAALWSFHTADSFEDAILTATNLGDDADTTAAVCGQVAGAHYGIIGIPGRWLEKLWEKQRILDVAEELLAGHPTRSLRRSHLAGTPRSPCRRRAW